MSIRTEIDRITRASSDIKRSIENKGVTVPYYTKIDGFAELIDAIETGGGSMSKYVTSGTTTSNVISTGLNNIEKFVMYSENKNNGLVCLFFDSSMDRNNVLYLRNEAFKKDMVNGITYIEKSRAFTNSGGTFGLNGIEMATYVNYNWIAIGTLN